MLFRCKNAAGGLLVARCEFTASVIPRSEATRNLGLAGHEQNPDPWLCSGCKGDVGKATCLRVSAQDRHDCFRGATCRMKQACIRATK
jgi:hypothetical protein